MGQAAATNWNAEHTDAKGYWVATHHQVESLAGLDLLDPSELDVPEFTLSGAEEARQSAPAEPLERWETLPTQVPDNAFEDEVTAPTDEVRLPQGRRIANVLVSREPSHNVAPTPVAHLPAAPAPQPAAPALDRKQIAAEMARKAASGQLSLEERRALAAQMAAAAKSSPQGVVRLADHRPAGSLPPVEELQPTNAEPVQLPERSQEAWGWDEADPLAVPAKPERPSLSIVQAAPPATDDFGDYLATPLPAPPRPRLQLPWPLPAQRAHATPEASLELGEPLVTEAHALSEVELAPEAPVRGSMLPTVLLVTGFLVGMAAFAAVSMAALVAAVVVAALV